MERALHIFSMDNSSLVYDKNKTFAGNKITLVVLKIQQLIGDQM